VIGQVRHPSLGALKAEGGERVASELSRLTGNYPIVNWQKEASLIVSKDGQRDVAEQLTGPTIWQLTSADESWRVFISPIFIALETTRYAGRTDFLARLASILRHYEKLVELPYVTRFGVRYTNRLTGQDLDRLEEIIQPQLVGVAATKMPADASLSHVFSSAAFRGPSETLHVNWGLLPPNGQFDPTFASIQERSWILDIDAFEEIKAAFDVDSTLLAIERLSARAYHCFRWATTDKFVDTYKER
jgi:uncharacterized protein (TIGR04255 family)